MTLILHKQHAQDRIEGRDHRTIGARTITPSSMKRWFGRICRQPVQENVKWLWFLHTVPAPPPDQGVADTLEEARAALAAL